MGLFDLEKDPKEMNNVYDDPACETLKKHNSVLPISIIFIKII